MFYMASGRRVQDSCAGGGQGTYETALATGAQHPDAARASLDSCNGKA
jgi:hypothetical protein